MKNFLKQYEIQAFFILTFLISLSVAIPLLLSLHGIIKVQFPGFTGLVAGSGPGWATIILLAVLYGKEGLKDLGKRLIKFNINYKWYLFTLLITGVFILVSIWLPSLFGGNFPSFMKNLPALIPTTIILTLSAGLGEEIGWRGFAAPKMQKKFSGLTTCIIMAIIWNIWHLALFFVPDGFHWQMWHEIGFWPAFVGYGIFLFAISVIYTWSYNRTKSLVLPMIMHGSMNGFSWFFSFNEIRILGAMPVVIYMILSLIVAVIILKYDGINLRWTEECEVAKVKADN